MVKTLFRGSAGIKTRIKSFLNSMEIICSGVVPSPMGRGNAVVCLFPYYTGQEGGQHLASCAGTRLSLCGRCVSVKAEHLDWTRGNHFADDNPYSERKIAVQDSLGFVAYIWNLKNHKKTRLFVAKMV